MDFTDTGRPSVKLRSLEDLISRKTTPEDVVPLLRTLIELAHLDTLINVFLSPPMGADGRAHPPLTLEATGIGRARSGSLVFDADKPTDEFAFNIQNIPERVRHIYIADPGCFLLELDAEKIEWILLMLNAGSRKAERAYREGADVHLWNARAIALRLGVEWERLSDGERKEMRRGAKRLTHGWDYGMSEFKTSRMYRMKLEEARLSRQGYFDEWPEIPIWQAEIEQRAIRDLMLRNAFGRYRRFLDVTSKVIKGKKVLQLGEFNEALAFLPASENADIWKIRVRELDDAGLVQLTGLHDSHLLQVGEDEVDGRMREALAICTRPLPELAHLNEGEPWVPRYSAKVGRNWGPCTEDNPEGLREVA